METTLGYSNYSERKQKSNYKIILLLILLITGGFNVYHGIVKHSEDANKVLNCLDKNGPELSYNKPDDIKVSLCWINEKDKDGNDKNVLGIHVQAKVLGKLENITSFINRNISTQYDMISFAEEDMGNYGWFSYAKEYMRTIVEILF